MSAWEATGKSDEWYTPRYVFDALGCRFDLDVAAPANGPRHVPCDRWIASDSLSQPWEGFVWMNPPFGGRGALAPWLDKFFQHGSGVALAPDRTSAPWWFDAAQRADAVLFVRRKIKFERPDGSVGRSPGTGTTLFACGPRACNALVRAEVLNLGITMRRV